MVISDIVLDIDETVEKLVSLKEFKPSSEDDEERAKLGFGK